MEFSNFSSDQSEKNYATDIKNNNIKYPTHTFLIRHFKTKNEQINYSGAYDEAQLYIDNIMKCVELNNIKHIDIFVSDTERTLLTSLVIYIKLNEAIKNLQISNNINKLINLNLNNSKLSDTSSETNSDINPEIQECDIIINKPNIDHNLFRDPQKIRQKEIKRYFKKCNKKYDKSNINNHKMIINITHSSVYKTIFEGFLNGLNADIDQINEIRKIKRIHANGMSYINNFDKTNFYFNKNMSLNNKKH